MKKILPLTAFLILSLAALPCTGEEESSKSSPHMRELEVLRKETEALPPSKARDERLGSYYYALGRVRIGEGRFDEALEALEKSEQYPVDREGVAYHRGLVFFMQRRYREAEAELFPVAYGGKGNGDALTLLGRIYYDRGELRGAIDAWERALALNRDDLDLAELLAKARKEIPVEERLDQAYTGKFVLQYDGRRDEALGDRVLAILAEAYNDVGVDLDHFPKEDITVILYTKKEFKEVTGGPDWSGGLYDGKIRVPLGGVDPDSARLKSLIYHEYAHAAVRSLAGGRCPRWLDEGFAVFEESRFVPFAGPAARKDKRSVSGAADLDALFSSDDGEEAGFAYGRSYAVVKRLADSFGIYRVAEWLHLIAENKPPDDAFTAVFGVYGLNLEKLMREE